MKIIISSDVTFDDKKIAENIRKHRSAAGYNSIAEASKALNISQPTLAKYERTPKKATLDMLEKMADLYGCLVDDFFMD